MKKARINISHFRFILLKLKIFGEIVTTFLDSVGKRKKKSKIQLLLAFCHVQTLAMIDASMSDEGV